MSANKLADSANSAGLKIPKGVISAGVRGGQLAHALTDVRSSPEVPSGQDHPAAWMAIDSIAWISAAMHVMASFRPAAMSDVGSLLGAKLTSGQRSKRRDSPHTDIRSE